MNLFDIDIASSRAWPVQEAKKILARLNNKLPNKGYVLFETGYGPSGLPHIGTFGEVVRTIMVQRAFEKISGMPTKLRCISDDMDGMRKIPETIPASYERYLHLPLSSVPDPFEKYDSFAQNMNSRLQAFLDSFDFEYEFVSATECYKNGTFNEGIVAVLRNYKQIMNIMLPTLREPRRQTYSPILPLCPRTGAVLQVPLVDYDCENATVTYIDSTTNERVTTSPLNGGCKLQWKVDMGMRWYLFDVDFEMYGKDHLVNGPIYSSICKTLGGRSPHQMFYELFLDEQGQKISKSSGNGLTIEEWLRYAPRETLALFMFHKPQEAKKLHANGIVRYADDYIAYWQKYSEQSDKANNPLYHIHNGAVPEFEEAMKGISYSLILNLVAVCGTGNVQQIYRYILQSRGIDAKQAADLAKNSFLYKIIEGAINLYTDVIRQQQQFKKPSAEEKRGLLLLQNGLKDAQKQPNIDAKSLQNITYGVARELQIEVKAWFQSLYEILLGQSAGPRFGSFVFIYGIEETIALIDRVLHDN